MANWEWARDKILPDRNGEKSRITQGKTGVRQTFDAHRARGSMGGVDISYPSNDSPPVFTCIAGKVGPNCGTDNWNTVNIIDANGVRHGFLHMREVVVKTGQIVKAGQQLGFEGGMGPKGGRKVNNAYTPHVHYQITDTSGKRVDPVMWWNGDRDPGEVDPNPNQSELPPEGGYPPDTSSPPAPPIGTIEEYMPKRAAPSQESLTSLAVWTNRMPMHEPWARMLLVDKTTNSETLNIEYNVNHVPQIDDDGTEKHSGLIGRLEGDQTIERGVFWRR